MNPKIDVLVNSHCLIAECPTYDKATDVLYWVDIFEKKIYRYYLKTRQLDMRNVSKYVSYIVPRKQGGVLLGLQDGIYQYDFDTQSLLFIDRPIKYDALTYRFNDGKCDVKGRLWTGTTAFFEEKNDCSLYRINRDYSFTQMFQGVNVSNGLGWSPDNKKMYYTDSGKKVIYSFDFNIENGALSNGQIIIDFKNEDANPDGMTVDAQGMLWICHWGGHKVSRWDPEKGRKIAEIAMPVKQVTCPVFVGNSLIVTTARYGCSAQELKDQPDAGNLFKISLGIEGAPSYSFDEG